MEFNYFKTSVMSVMAAGAFAFSASVSAAAPVSVVPAQGTVETLETIDLVFNEGDEVAWVISKMDGSTAPRFTVNGDLRHIAGPSNLDADGNKLIVKMDEMTRAGKYELIIAAGTYTINGEPGDACTYKWDVEGIELGLAVEPNVANVSEIQNIKITFQDYNSVSVTQWETTKTATLYKEDENGELQRRGSFQPQCYGNSLILNIGQDAITEPGEYVVMIPVGCVLVDGEPYNEPIEIHYTILEPLGYPDVVLSVNPAVDTVETLETIEVTFDGVSEVHWDIAENTAAAPYLVDMEGNRWATFTLLSNEENTLSLGLRSEFYEKGEYNVVIPAGSYAFGAEYNGLAGKEIKLKFEVLGLTGVSVEPDVNVVNEIQNLKITFHEAKTVTLAEDLGTTNTPYLVLVTEDGVRERRGSFMPQVAGNSMILTMNQPIYEEGEYVVVVPGTTYFLDGNAGADVEFGYTVVAPSYPEIELDVNPAVDKVETLETIELTFGGVDVVEWAVTGTENAPYLVDSEGTRFATFANLNGDGNMLSLGLFSEFDVKGEYEVIIPEGSYVFQGIYHGMKGKEIRLNYEVLGLTGISTEPAVNVLTEIQNIKVTFHEGKEVTLAEDLGTNNTPVLYLVTEEGVRERRGSFMPQVVGNNMLLTMNTPIYDEGEYVIVIPGTCYFLDGNAGTDVEFGYTVVAPSYPDVTLHTNPAAEFVETLETIEITFEGVDLVQWTVTGTENAPYLVDLDGNRWATFANLSGLGNMLSLGLYGEFDVKGDYQVIIPEGSYVFGGIYRGMPGKEIVLNYEVTGAEGISVEPAVDTVSEIQNIKITFNEAKEVTLAEDLGTLKTPVLYFVTEDPETGELVRERRGTFLPQVAGNNMFLTLYNPVTEPGEYVVVVPGTVYFLDGVEGEDIELHYTVFETEPEVTYDVFVNGNALFDGNKAEKIENIQIQFTSLAADEEAYWNVSALKNGEVAYPSYVCGEETGDLENVWSFENSIFFGPKGIDAITENGYYVVTVPAESYKLNGKLGQEIVLYIIVEAGSAVDAIFGENVNVDVYDLNGRVVLRNADAAAVKALRGIYVIDGKKFILR